MTINDDTAPVRRAPAGLKVRGKRFWKASMEAFDFTDAETALLEEACRTLDNVDLLADAIARDGAMVLGSTGQPVVHPALTEARGQRVVLHRLIAALALPDDDGQSVPSGRSLSASTAAQARWKPAAVAGLREVR